MMLRVNNEYLDFNQPIEQDRKAKLFEAIEEIEGDVSFEFELYLSSPNSKKLDFPFPDSSSKLVYQAIDADLMNDEGQLVSKGFIKIERKIGNNLFCSFFGGNSNWFAMLTGNMTDLRLSQYDVDQTEFTIRDSWDNTSGIVWPILDAGGLSTRSNPDFKTEDFIPAFYAKTLMFEVFQQSGIKIAGELLKDWRYNNMIIAANGRSQEEVDNRSSFVLKTTDQAVDNTLTKITFDDDSNFPYFDGSQDNFSIALSRFTADVRMTVRAVATSRVSSAGAGGFLSIIVNGAPGGQAVSNLQLAVNNSVQGTINLEAGDYIEVFYETFVVASTGTMEEATFKITPIYLYKAFGGSAVPKWTKQQFVSQVLAPFNVIPAFDPYTKTVTFNLFDKLKEKEPIDISEFIEEPEVDFSELIADYGRRNNFIYQETDIDNLKEYNISEFVKYGSGVIEATNDFIDESVPVLESDFSSPISYINGIFDMSMDRIQFIEFDTESTEITSVTTPGFDIARFNVAEDIFAVDDLVRISNSTNVNYNGEWIVSAVGAGFIQCLGPTFDTDATATIEKLIHKFSTDDNVYILLNIPDYSIGDVSGVPFTLNQNSVFTAAFAYFNLLNTGKQINTDYKQGLSFGPIVNPLFYQRTMIEDYWNTFGRILNDPVKLRANAYLPWIIHNQIDFLRPIMIKTLETTNLYYCNREIGYQNSYTPCELELIKLP